MDTLGNKKSVIKRFTLIGAITGGLSGFLLAAVTAVLFPHPTGGRPLITFPPYLIISYEMTILFGILATVLGFLISARLPAIRERLYVPEAAVDKFVVTVACDNAREPSMVEISIIIGSLALFTTLFLLFVKIFPSVSIYEIKETMDVPKKGPSERGVVAWQTT